MSRVEILIAHNNALAEGISILMIEDDKDFGIRIDIYIYKTPLKPGLLSKINVKFHVN